jgi:hypothetical protein
VNETCKVLKTLQVLLSKTGLFTRRNLQRGVKRNLQGFGNLTGFIIRLLPELAIDDISQQFGPGTKTLTERNR